MSVVADLRDHLVQLEAERALAVATGLGDVTAYMADIEADINASRHAYVGAAVSEIAFLRAELSGRQAG